MGCRYSAEEIERKDRKGHFPFHVPIRLGSLLVWHHRDDSDDSVDSKTERNQ